LLLLPEHASAAKRSVAVKFNHSQAKKVTIAGSFNGWHPESTPLRCIQPGEWMTELILEAGVYEYRFLVDGQWADDPVAQRSISNNFGSRNFLMEIS